MLEPHSIYAREKLYAAIDTLATHPGKIKERLRVAALDLVLIPRGTLPKYEAVDADIAWIIEQLTCREEQFEGQGRIAATLHSMRSAKAMDIASRILTAHAKLDYYITAKLHG